MGGGGGPNSIECVVTCHLAENRKMYNKSKVRVLGFLERSLDLTVNTYPSSNEKAGSLVLDDLN